MKAWAFFTPTGVYMGCSGAPGLGAMMENIIQARGFRYPFDPHSFGDQNFCFQVALYDSFVTSHGSLLAVFPGKEGLWVDNVNQWHDRPQGFGQFQAGFERMRALSRQDMFCSITLMLSPDPQILSDQIHVIDKKRLIERLGRFSPSQAD